MFKLTKQEKLNIKFSTNYLRDVMGVSDEENERLGQGYIEDLKKERIEGHRFTGDIANTGPTQGEQEDYLEAKFAEITPEFRARMKELGRKPRITE